MTYLEWLTQTRYFCPCGHVEWAHWPNGRCAHCVCNRYHGEERPLTDYEKMHLKDVEIETENKG